ncbi:YheC/YheD family endospore coat-associated protein [Candidatus Contubernalis alkaliaceticus]|uniref:YheC/YheD family endospore coat-associated protein n=1 Tax=Candidatus Contubernalis alkaliaceticus TaxID=338645 RepID=UPI001F4BFAC2|nr:YheC/YheD family protein [Candidatus Contubernalis alkalaceticus]UNC93216.1 YheC/YheD family protein [Candidatus Contubernalis alkalaceticus]
MRENPQIGIVLKNPRPISRYESVACLGASLLLFRPSEIIWKEQKIKGLLFSDGVWKKTYCSFPLAVYNRCYSSKSSLAKKLERIIGRGKVFNHITRFDKWKIYCILKNSEIHKYLPDTYRYSQENMLNLLREYKKLVLKPSRGYLGRSVYCLELAPNSELQLFFKTSIPRLTTTSEKDFVEEIKKITGTRNFILQQFINLEEKDKQVYDIRMVVQKNGIGKWEVSGGCSRQSLANYYLTNSPRRVKSFDKLIAEDNLVSEEIIEQIKNISLKTAVIIEKEFRHMGEISVDFGVDSQGKLWIIEANGKPQKILIDRLKDEELSARVYRRPLEYAFYLAGGTRNEGEY